MVLARRTIARVLELRRGADETALQQEVRARLQVRQVRDRHEQLASGTEDAMELRERPWLLVEREVLEDVEAQRAVERFVRKGERRQRSAAHAIRGVVRVEALDVQPAAVLVDEDSFAAAGVEHARAGRHRIEPAAHGFELGDVGRVVLPVRIGRSVVITARGVLAAAHHRRAGGHGRADYTGGVLFPVVSDFSRTLTPVVSGFSRTCHGGIRL